MSNPVFSWAKEHPVAAGGVALGVVVIAMLLFGSSGSGGDASGSGDGVAGLQAYYGAVAAQGQAGAAIQMEQIKANASTNQALIAASYGIQSQEITAGTQSQYIASNERVVADTNQKSYDATIAQINSQERLGANNIALQQQLAVINGQTAIKVAKANKKSSTAQNISAIGGAVSSIGKTIGSFF